MDPHTIILDKLQDDKNYYGEYGRNYLSYSDIIVLLKSPDNFKLPTPKTKPMVEGTYFHTAMLEPDLIKDFQVIDVASRSTKAYKEACGPGEILLLKKEQEHLDTLVDKMKGNIEMYDEIYTEGNEYEKPEVANIMNNMWKGKADVVTGQLVIDLKTCSDLTKFEYSARTYNYDAQAYIYQRLFGKPMRFYVICKQTLRLGIYDCSPGFVEGGQRKVEQATEIYEKFFGDEATHDISTYIHRQTL